MSADEQASVPALRFPEFEGEWEKTILGAVCESLDKRRVPIEESVRAQRPGPYPYYGASGVIDHIDGFLFDESLVLLAEDGANIVTRSTPVAFLAKGKFWVNNHAHVYRAKKSSEFLAAYLQNLRFEKFNTGTAQPKLNGETCKKIPLRMPAESEQKKIADFLGAVDEKLTALRRKKALLTDYKRGAMQKIFSQQIRFTRDDGSAFPDWEEKRLGDVFRWVRTNSLSREQLTYESGTVQNIHYGDIHSKFKAQFRQEEETIPFVRSSGVTKKFDAEEFCRLGDVVIADASEDYADIGKAIEIMSVVDGTLVAGLHTYIARAQKSVLALGFSGYLLKSEKVRKQIMRVAQGISVLGLSKANLNGLTLALPHPDEQKKIADFLSSLDAKIDKVAEQITQMESFKKGLLQQMFV